MSNARIYALLLALPLAAIGWRASAPANADAQVVIATARQRLEATDAHAYGRLVRVKAGGARKTYNFSMKAKWFPDGLRMLCEITSPVQARMRILLARHADGAHAIEVANPGDAQPTRLPFAKWKDGVLGTDFSYEDLMQDELFWRKQTLVGREKYGARDCFVVRSEPGPADETHYRSATTWLDQTVEYPVHVEKLTRTSGSRKEYIFYGLRETKGVWSATQVEVKIEGQPGSSLLIIERGSAMAHLQPTDFDPALLTRP